MSIVRSYILSGLDSANHYPIRLIHLLVIGVLLSVAAAIRSEAGEANCLKSKRSSVVALSDMVTDVRDCVEFVCSVLVFINRQLALVYEVHIPLRGYFVAPLKGK